MQVSTERVVEVVGLLGAAPNLGDKVAQSLEGDPVALMHRIQYFVTLSGLGPRVCQTQVTGIYWDYTWQ